MSVEFSGGPLDGRRQVFKAAVHSLTFPGLLETGQRVEYVYGRRLVNGVAVATANGVALFDFVLRRFVAGGPGPRGGGDG